MARATDFDLAKELGKPSFTPAQRDAPALVELVVAGEDPSAERAATALAGLGDAGRRALEARLAGDDPHPDEDATELSDGATARLVGALGLFARRGDAEARKMVIARRAQALALDAAADPDCRCGQLLGRVEPELEAERSQRELALDHTRTLRPQATTSHAASSSSSTPS